MTELTAQELSTADAAYLRQHATASRNNGYYSVADRLDRIANRLEPQNDVALSDRAADAIAGLILSDADARGDRPRCLMHGITDCSPLLNGCSYLNHEPERR